MVLNYSLCIQNSEVSFSQILCNQGVLAMQTDSVPRSSQFRSTYVTTYIVAVAVGESWVLRGKLWHCARVNDKQNYGLTMNERVNTHAIQLDQVTGLRMFYRE